VPEERRHDGVRGRVELVVVAQLGDEPAAVASSPVNNRARSRTSSVRAGPRCCRRSE
jgi:hypothetical protein